MREANLYPHSGWELREALARFAGVDGGSVILGNGSTEVLDVVTRTFIVPGRRGRDPGPDLRVLRDAGPAQRRRRSARAGEAGPGLRRPGGARGASARGRRSSSCAARTTRSGGAGRRPRSRRCWPPGSRRSSTRRTSSAATAESFARAGREPSEPDRDPDDVEGVRACRASASATASPTPRSIDLLLRVRIPFSISLVAIRAGLAAVGDPRIVETRRALHQRRAGSALRGPGGSARASCRGRPRRTSSRST